MKNFIQRAKVFRYHDAIIILFYDGSQWATSLVAILGCRLTV